MHSKSRFRKLFLKLYFVSVENHLEKNVLFCNDDKNLRTDLKNDFFFFFYSAAESKIYSVFFNFSIE